MSVTQWSVSDLGWRKREHTHYRAKCQLGKHGPTRPGKPTLFNTFPKPCLVEEQYLCCQVKVFSFILSLPCKQDRDVFPRQVDL